MEASHDIKLFIRTGRGVDLTEAGRLFRDFALRIVRDVELLKSEMQQLRGEINGEVLVTIPLRVGRLILAPLVRRFSENFPKAAIYVYENINPVSQELLVSGEMDIGLFYDPPRPPSIIIDKIGNEDLYLIGKPDILGKTDQPIDLADVAQMPLILPGPHSHYRGYVDKVFSSIGLSPTIVRELDTVDGLLSFVAEGEGVTILPYSNVAREVDEGRATARKIINPPIRRRLCVATGKHATSSLVRKTVTLLKQVIIEHGEPARWLLDNKHH